MASVVETATLQPNQPFPSNPNLGTYPTQQARPMAAIDTTNGVAGNQSFAQPSTPQHRNMSYSMGPYGHHNGLPANAQNNYGNSNSNGAVQHQQQYETSQPPLVYTVCASLPHAMLACLLSRLNFRTEMAEDHTWDFLPN